MPCISSRDNTADGQELYVVYSLRRTYVAALIPADPADCLTVLLRHCFPHSGSAPGDLTVRRTGSAVTVTSRGSTANVIAADVAASAGYAHVVDAVLLPVYTTLAQVSGRVWGTCPVLPCAAAGSTVDPHAPICHRLIELN